MPLSIVLILIVSLLLPLESLWAQESRSGITISADDSRQDLTKNTIELIGNVRVLFKDQVLTAEYARIEFSKKTLYAKGQVRVTSIEAEMSGDEALFDTETGSGYIQNGILQAGAVYFEGRSLIRTENNEYIAENGKYTTCVNCPETWSFVSSKIRAELGGYAYMKNLVIRFGGVPVFWMPYLIVPLKSERQTGLLAPELEFSSRGGATLTQSFFWATSESQDFLFSLKNYELRGLKALVNYRYVLNKNSYGELDFASISDRAISDEDRFQSFARPGDDFNRRWFIKYNHYYEMPEGFIHRTTINNASDLQYPKDFPLETRNHGDSAMENRMSLTKNTESLHSSMELGYYINLMDSDPLSNNEYSVHRLPDIRLSRTSTQLMDTNWRYEWDLSHTQFARNTFGYDNINQAYDETQTTGRHLEAGGSVSSCSESNWYQNPKCEPLLDGEFNPERDLIRSGQRLDLRAQIYRTFDIGKFQVTPRAGFRNQSYDFDIAQVDRTSRQLLRTEVMTTTQFYRISESGFKHEIRPEVSLIAIPWLSEKAHPFFGDSAQTPYLVNANISNQDLNSPWGLQFDYYDRVFDRKVITAGVTNKWVERIRIPNSEQVAYKTRALWRLRQSYDFYQAELNSSRSQPLGDLNSELILSLDRFNLYQSATYYPYNDVTNVSSRVRIPGKRNSFYEIAHLLSYNVTPGQEVIRSNRTEDLTLYAKNQFDSISFLARGTWDINMDRNNSGRLKSIGWSAQVKLPGDCWYITFAQYQVTGGDSIVKINFDFIWDPNHKPGLPEDFVNQIGF